METLFGFKVVRYVDGPKSGSPTSNASSTATSAPATSASSLVTSAPVASRVISSPTSSSVVSSRPVVISESSSGDNLRSVGGVVSGSSVSTITGRVLETRVLETRFLTSDDPRLRAPPQPVQPQPVQQQQQQQPQPQPIVQQQPSPPALRNPSPPPPEDDGLYGVGIALTQDRYTQNIIVGHVTPGGPADACSIKVGDIIRTVDLRQVKNLSGEVVARLIMGRRGTPVDIGVESPDVGYTRHTMIRQTRAKLPPGLGAVAAPSLPPTFPDSYPGLASSSDKNPRYDYPFGRDPLLQNDRRWGNDLYSKRNDHPYQPQPPLPDWRGAAAPPSLPGLERPIAVPPISSYNLGITPRWQPSSNNNDIRGRYNDLDPRIPPVAPSAGSEESERRFMEALELVRRKDEELRSALREHPIGGNYGGAYPPPAGLSGYPTPSYFGSDNNNNNRYGDNLAAPKAASPPRNYDWQRERERIRADLENVRGGYDTFGPRFAPPVDVNPTAYDRFFNPTPPSYGLGGSMDYARNRPPAPLSSSLSRLDVPQHQGVFTGSVPQQHFGPPAIVNVASYAPRGAYDPSHFESRWG